MGFFNHYLIFFIVFLKEIFTLLFISFIVMFYKEKRKNFYPKLIFYCLFSVIMAFLISMLRTDYDQMWSRYISTLIVNVITLGFLFLLYKEKLPELIFGLTATIAIKGISGNGFALILNIFGKDDLNTISFFDDYLSYRDWGIKLLIELFFIILLFFLFIKPERKNFFEKNKIQAIVLFICTFLLDSGVYITFTSYAEDNFILSVCCKSLFVIIYILILAIRGGFFSEAKTKQELLITNKLLDQEKKHYNDLRDNIDLINMKVHDLRRQLTTFQSKLTQEELSSLKEAIKIYDENIKTNCDVLNLLLLQKSLYCRKNKINLTCLVNGDALNFICNDDLYIIFSNALENALEAVSLVKEEKKVISITVTSKEDITEIEITNYFLPRIETNIKTTKQDIAHHGYGLKSLNYVVKKYLGQMKTEQVEDIFFLTITFPQPKNNLKNVK